ncbi:cellulose 1,4-beta-cellobiosidase [Salinibacterium sp. CAN_S4]|uniref:glycoside hydrolase family 6 protein n=1 Tax=Salinibacterium sp. CAN_S4 TaxID=2787727 RepID=UPI0018EFD254
MNTQSPLSRRFGRAVAASGISALLAVGMLTATPAVAAPPRVDNPFAGATNYVNPDYAALVNTSIAAASTESAKRKMRTIQTYPTAVWMDRIAAIAGGASNGGRRSLEGHLDAALAQKKAGVPMTVQIVIYDLPGRDCAALASNGELPLTAAGLQRYKTEYIDAIAAVFAKPKFADLRITTVVEVDGLPNLVTNVASDPDCQLAKSSGIQVKAMQYALDKLGAIPNVYNYMDIAHSGWLGWDNNLTPTVQLYTDLVRGTAGGFGNVSGFATNTSNYTPTAEPFLTDPEKIVGGVPVKSDPKFYEYNPRFDESDFTASLYSAFVAAGWPADIGMIVDTSRNGWGGSKRPTAVSSSTNVSTYVAESKIDQRNHRGAWCNLSGAGMGAAPQASPAGFASSHLDAFVWVKPPGESDGASSTIPNNEGKAADPMCDPTFNAPVLMGQKTGALPNAPLAGYWFGAQFAMLVGNAFPAIPEAGGPTQPGDTTAPTAPTALRVTATTATSVSLSWTASTDNVGVSGYSVYRGTTPVAGATVIGTTATVPGLTPDTAYSFRVEAKDSAGNRSAPSAAVSVRTATSPGGGGSGSCTATYAVTNSWSGGFVADVTVTNPGPTATKSWTVGWTLASGQAITNMWSASNRISGAQVTVSNAEYNGAIAPGAAATFGFQGTGAGAAGSPLTCTATR